MPDAVPLPIESIAHSYIVVDSDAAHRNRLARAIAAWAHVVPVAAITELGREWPGAACLIVRDDGTALTDCFARMRRDARFSAVLAYDDSPRIDRVVDVIQDGAVGYLALPLSDHALRARIEAVLARSTLAIRRRDLQRATRARFDKLSTREQTILHAMVDGRSNKQIALDLELSPRTVEMHRAGILAKLGGVSSHEAVGVAIGARDAAERDADETRVVPEAG